MSHPQINLEANKTIIQNFIQAVWNQQNLNALPEYWNANCTNHAMPGDHNNGLEMLHAYHAGFLQAFDGIEVYVQINQQIAEGEHVMTFTSTRAKHDKSIMGIVPTGKTVTLDSIRIDRLEHGKISEHWSVADMAGLMQQLQG
jgi:predicted ester cyclase